MPISAIKCIGIPYLIIPHYFSTSWIWIINEHINKTEPSTSNENDDNNDDNGDEKSDSNDDGDDENERHEIPRIVIVNDREGERRFKEKNLEQNIKIIRLDKVKKLPRYSR